MSALGRKLPYPLPPINLPNHPRRTRITLVAAGEIRAAHCNGELIISGKKRVALRLPHAFGGRPTQHQSKIQRLPVLHVHAIDDGKQEPHGANADFAHGLADGGQGRVEVLG